ncbi:MAG: RNA-binding protein [Chitinivibrionales bacterium]|nr:RNA-binding protein [Chitinivibrionales bacterium]
MNKKLYVGNLPFAAAEQGVESLFSMYGKVKSVTIVRDRYTQKSRGFGFVEFEQGDPEKAINNLNGTMMGGRIIRVSEAKERRSAQPSLSWAD